MLPLIQYSAILVKDEGNDSQIQKQQKDKNYDNDEIAEDENQHRY